MGHGTARMHRSRHCRYGAREHAQGVRAAQEPAAGARGPGPDQIRAGAAAGSQAVPFGRLEPVPTFCGQ